MAERRLGSQNLRPLDPWHKGSVVEQDDRAFISYSRSNSAFALRLAGDLKAAGASVWLDQLDIRRGDRWDQAVEDALNHCTRMLVILSPASVNSTNVMDEVSFALEEGKAVIPILFQECKVPFRLRRIQYVDFRQDYLPALQDLLLTFRFRQKAEQDKSVVRDVESHIVPPASDADELNESDEAVPAHTKEMRSGTPGQAKEGFCLPWVSKGQASMKIQNAAVLLTNLAPLTSADLSPLVERCRDAAKTLIVVAPALESSAAKLVNSAGGLAVEARDLDGQPMDELLVDLGIYLGGNAMLREFGFGLPNRGDGEELSNGVICQFTQIADISFEYDLGSARMVSNDAHGTCFEAQDSSSYLASRIKELRHRASHCARSHNEFKGLSERLRRFGVVETLKESLLALAPFAHDANEVTLPAGFASWYFLTDPDHYTCTIKKPKTLVTTCPLYDADAILPALQQVVTQAAEGLVVFAPRIREEALAMMVMNRLRGAVLSLAVEVADSEHLSAIAHLTGAKLVDKADADQLLGPSVGRMFGDASEVVSEIGRTRVKR